MKILILKDYRNAFYSSTKNARTICSVDILKLENYLKEYGFEVEVLSFANIDLQRDYKDTYVWYTSSEDPDLYYRSYIEDVILALHEKGAKLIPDFKYLHAHHNKCFMEMLRIVLFPEQYTYFQTRTFGSYEDLEYSIKNEKWEEKKYVIKKAYGAGSSGVSCSNGVADLIKESKKVSRTVNLAYDLKECIKRRLRKNYSRYSLHRTKFIVQNMIPGLEGDFKVLKYGCRFYTLYRKNKKNDFRASGAGRLSFKMPAWINENDLLNFAEQVSNILGVPMCSLDIAYDGKRFYLLEFQCLCFGPYTAERSEKYFHKINNEWEAVYEQCDLEKIMCEAIYGSVKKNMELSVK